MFFQKKNLALLIVFVAFHQFLNAQISQTINGLSSNYVESIKSDDLGIIWIGTNEGLNALIDGQIYQYQSSLNDPTSLLNTQINEIYVTDNNTIIAFSNDGLSVFQRSNNSFKQIRTETRPISMYEDPFSNDIYIATENNGLITLDNNLEVRQSYKFDVFDPSTISTNNLTSLTDESGIYFEQNKIWIATDRGINIINRSDSSVSRRLENANGSLSSNVINGFSSIKINSSMIEPRSDYLLIGTDRGLDIYDRDNDNLINQKQFVNSDVKNIIKINSKLFALLVNSKLTLLEYDSINQKFESKIIEASNDDLSVKKIHKEGDYLLVSGENFVSVYDNEFKIIFEKITDYSITEIDIKGDFLWVATQNGLIKYNLKGSFIIRSGEGTDYFSRNEYYEITLKDNIFFVRNMLDENSIKERLEILNSDIAKVQENLVTLEKQTKDGIAMLNALNGAKQQCQSFLNELNNGEPETSDSSDVE